MRAVIALICVNITTRLRLVQFSWTYEISVVDGLNTAIYAGLIALAAAVLAVETEPDRDPQRTGQTCTRETATAVPEPGKIRLELPIKLLEQAWTMEQLRRSDPGRLGIGETPPSEIRLLDSDHLVANWRNGRVQYVVKGVNPWGASVGGQLSSSTAKVTLTWSFND